jgi:hypothetical protein
MATPRIFVSSTCYDLKYIRENLKFFIRTIGYDPILSEDGDVFYNPKLHTHDSCLSEIETTQMLVLIIGGRFGGKFKNSEKSITNAEYNSAVKNRIPIFALVESGVYADHFVHQKNKENTTVQYPSVDNVKVFDFIDEVRKNSVNNALVPFRDFADIESYLKKQWAGMMHYFLTTESETKRVSDLLNEISVATQKIEYFTKNIATNTADKKTLIDIKLYDAMIGNDAVSTLTGNWHLKITPYLILKNATIDDVTEAKITIVEDKEGHVVYGGHECRLTKNAYKSNSRNYTSLRQRLIEILNENDMTLEEYLAQEGN